MRRHAVAHPASQCYESTERICVLKGFEGECSDSKRRHVDFCSCPQSHVEAFMLICFTNVSLLGPRPLS
eukprot:15473783-Alexandrium_andersonii.AAC.1